MSQPKFNKRQIDARVKEATALAKKGNYDKASYILHPIQSDKRAKRLLEQMAGRSNKVKPTDFFNGTILTMLGVGIIIIGMVVVGLQNFGAEFAERQAVYDEFPARGLAGNQELFVDLVVYCRETVESDCFDWSEDVFINYPTQVGTCVLLNGEGFTIDDTNRESVTACFTEQGIPAPY